MTPDDVVRWKDQRLREGKSAKTIKDSDLSALNSVFGWAARNRRVASNPAQGVTVKVAKKKRERSKGLTDDEAADILRAAEQYVPSPKEHPKTTAAKRWLPWLCAYTGARVGEVAQLRKEDLHHSAGHWTITITPEAGTVKSKERRDVPLHTHLVELGFPEFVERSAKGHLFVTPAATGDVLGPLQGLKNRVTEFVRTVLKDRRVAPNHGWRHRFKTAGRDVGVDERVLDAICGHAPGTVGAGYGDVSVKAMAAALAKFPRYHAARALLAEAAKQRAGA